MGGGRGGGDREISSSNLTDERGGNSGQGGWVRKQETDGDRRPERNSEGEWRGGGSDE